jgi:hypothetical protein
MNEDLLVLFGLAALAVFILWDGLQRRRRNLVPVASKGMPRRFARGETELYAATFVAGVIDAVMFADPPDPPFHGRSAAFGDLLYGIAGPFGIPVAVLLLTLALLALALSARRRRLSGQVTKATGR